MWTNGPPKWVEYEEIGATARFLALVAPLFLLPSKRLNFLFGLNPRRVWFVVVFVAGLSFAGYLLAKLLDAATALGLTAAAGGCASPGLTILWLTERSRRHHELERVHALAAVVAASMVFPRNLAVVGIVHPSLARSLAIPFLAMAAASVCVVAALWIRVRNREPASVQLDTPFRIGPAFVIGTVVAVVMIVLEALELSVPTALSRFGIVGVTLAEISIYTGVTAITDDRRMAKTLTLLLVLAASAGILGVLAT